MAYDDFTDTEDEGKPAAEEPAAASTKRSGDYDVGYCKPPVEGQFKKGQSGNPGGKKKKAPAEPLGRSAVQDILIQELSEMHTITKNGRPQKVSALQLIIKGVVVDAAKRDPKARRELIALLKQMEMITVSEVQGGGVLVVGAPLNMEQWYAKHGGVKPIQTHPLLEAVREQLENDDDEK